MEGGLEGGWEAQEEAGVELKGRRGKKADFGGFLAEQAEANSYLEYNSQTLVALHRGKKRLCP